MIYDLMKMRILIASILFFVSYALVGQTATLNFKRYSKKNGLSSNDVTAFAQTPDGYMWIGTTNGLNRFNGLEYETFRKEPENKTSLTDNHITALLVDHNGVLWVGTESGGLLKYMAEKESFVQYKHNFSDANSLSNSYVTSIREDINNRLWVGTVMGLNLYVPEDDNFKRYFYEISVMIDDRSFSKLREKAVPKNILTKLEVLKDSVFANQEVFRASLKNLLQNEKLTIDINEIYRSSNTWEKATNIRDLESDSNGNLWLVYEKGGVSKFNVRTYQISTINGLDDKIGDIFFHKGYVYIGLLNGEVFKIDIHQDTVTKLDLAIDVEGIETIFKDAEDNFWIGHYYGLSVVDGQGKEAESLEIDPSEKWGVPTSAIKTFFQDNQNNFWIGIVQGGITQVLNNQPFNTFNSHKLSQIPLTKDPITAVLEDSKGRLWFGYYNTGIDIWDPKTETVTHFRHKKDDPSSLGQGSVFSIFEDQGGTIWIGSYQGGLQEYNPETQNFNSYPHDPNNKESISGNDVRSIREDSQGNLWLAVHGGGLNKFNKTTKKATRFYADFLNWENSLINNWLNDLEIDGDDQIWITSVAGLTRFNPKTKTFKTFNTVNSDLTHDNIRSIHLDARNQLWLATDNGLNCFNIVDEKFVQHPYFDDLKNSAILGVVTDLDDNLWVSTKYNLLYLDTAFFHMDIYKESEDFASNEFFYDAFELGANGSIYLGGFQGLLAVHPNKIKTSVSNIPLVLTQVLVNAQQEQRLNIEPQEDGRKFANFEHDQNYIKFSYMGINFEQANQLEYAYKLEGYDRDWNYVKKNREAIYSNIPKGEYSFLVKVSNGHNVWTLPQNLMQFKIQAPWWNTNLARALYVLCGLLLFVLIRKLIIAKEQAKNELKLQELQKRILQEFDALKVKFYAGISQDLETPFNLLRRPLEKLIADKGVLTDTKRITYFKLINKNAAKVIRLIEQLSDISAFDTKLMPLQVSQNDVVKYCQLVINSFNFRAEKKNIDLFFESDKHALNVYFDVNKMEKILYYLISHEIQNTVPYGQIKVVLTSGHLTGKNTKDFVPSASEHPSHVNIQIKSTPVKGVSKFNKSQNFESETEMVDTNYAIALGKQLTLLHLGQFNLYVSKNEIKYNLCLPVTKETFRPEQIVQVSDLPERMLNFANSLNSDQLEDTLDQGFWSTQTVYNSNSQEESPFLILLYEVIDAQMGNNQFGPDLLAEYMNLSRSQLYKKVKALTNLSVSIVIRNRRLLKSLALLSHTELTISEIAYTMGFNDPAYYTRCFKKRYGKSPKEFIKNLNYDM